MILDVSISTLLVLLLLGRVAVGEPSPSSPLGLDLIFDPTSLVVRSDISIFGERSKRTSPCEMMMAGDSPGDEPDDHVGELLQ